MGHTLPMQCPCVAALAMKFCSHLNIGACTGIEKGLGKKLRE